MKKTIGLLLAVILIASVVPTVAYAADDSVQTPEARICGDSAVTFSNLSKLSVNESATFNIIDADGNPATIGVERIATRAATEYRVWYIGVIINAEFYMTVDNNKVTSVYDYKIIIIGGTYEDAKLSKSSSYGKLDFKFESWGPIVTGNCWLKGTVTGSNNEITVSWSM